MANDIDMWNDIEEYEKEINATAQRIANDLLECYNAKYQEGNDEKAEKLKSKFQNKYSFWENYY